MRIAVFEPQTRLCGVTAWAFHAVEGFRRLGHQAEVISFSKTGRPPKSTPGRKSGWYWYPKATDAFGKWSDAAKMLDTYDLIVVVEPKHGSLDRDALKRWKDAGIKPKRAEVADAVPGAIEKLGDQALPEYILALRRVTKPWISVLHSPQYQPALAPFLPYLLEAGPRGFVEHQPGAAESGEWAGLADVPRRVLRLLPYVPERDSGYSTGNAVGMAGRYVPNKGQPTLAVHADHLPGDWVARLRGSESGTLGPCYSYLTYECLVRDFGWRGHRDGLKESDQFGRVPGIGNHGDLQNGKWPWWVEKDDHRVEYLTAYSDPVGIWDDTPVAVNLTASDFAVGIEYTMLEAMDAGSLVVAPRFSLDAPEPEDRQHAAYGLELFQHPLTIKSNAQINDVPPDVAAELHVQLRNAASAVGTITHKTIVDHNRDVIRRLHDPARFAQLALEVGGVA